MPGVDGSLGPGGFSIKSPIWVANRMDSSESAKFKVDLKAINPFVSYGVSPIAKKEKGPVPSQFAESANLGEKMPKIIRKRNSFPK